MQYSPPVSHLLTYSDFYEEDSFNWPDYLGLGLGKEDIPELIQILDDEELYPPDEEVDEYCGLPFMLGEPWHSLKPPKLLSLY